MEEHGREVFGGVAREGREVLGVVLGGPSPMSLLAYSLPVYRELGCRFSVEEVGVDGLGRE